MRHITLLIALFALVWSGLHAEPANAGENDPVHSSVSAVPSHSEDRKDKSDQGGEQHACHHHCPNAPAPRAMEALQLAVFAKQPVFGAVVAALHPTGGPPPLDPPIS